MRTFNVLILLALLGFYRSGFALESEPLPPEEAFELKAEVTDKQTVRLSWTIAEGYYLYRHKFQFVAQTPEQIRVGEPGFPVGRMQKDKQFGEQEVYRELLMLELPVRRLTDKPVELSLQVVFQGCADAGFCYLPIRQSITLPAEP